MHTIETVSKLYGNSAWINDCLEWTGKSRIGGYGAMRISGMNKIMRTHLIAWEIHHGERPPGLVVRHSCDNKLCFHIDHLLSGSIADNMKDRYEREKYQTVRKLSDQDRMLIKNDPRKQIEIAQEWLVSQSVVSRIKNHWAGPGHPIIR
jgi:hypothetical protein